jgi:multisubunit Na+/H+ antiporter MnhE subunit
VARAGETLVWWLVLVGVWVSTLSTVTAQEVVAATVAGLPCAVAATVARRTYRGRWKPVRAWRLPVAILRDCAALLSRDSAIRRIPVQPKEKAVQTMVVSASPGTVVLDDEGRSLVVHAVGREARE